MFDGTFSIGECVSFVCLPYSDVMDLVERPNQQEFVACVDDKLKGGSCRIERRKHN